MTGEMDAFAQMEWLTLPAVAERLGVSVGRVRSMIDDRQLTGVRRDGVFSIPADFLTDEGALSSLRGTLFVLHDVGFTDEEAVRWLVEPEDSIGIAPLQALRQGRKSEVRRVARALA